jgi:peptidoglycan/LPS O-acetylase OafA/YrhL
MKLSDYATGRDNTFNLLRFAAAFAVLYSHSYALVLGPENHEPFVNWLGYTLAGIAVDVFFITSGFLVCESLLRLDNFKAFCKARALRIFPALVVMSVLLAGVLGPLLTTLPLGDYFSRTEVYKFLFKDATILTGVKFKLPGVFDGLPMDEVVNGSLWTLPFELRCYLVLALVWIAARIARHGPLHTFVRLVLVTAGLMLIAFWIAHTVGYKHWHTFRLFYFFFGGAAFWLMRSRIALNHGVALAVAALLAFGIFVPRLFFWIYPLTITYLVLYVAYVPGGWIRGFNRFGDYSYGIYIYAFPVQQTLVLLVAGITPAQLIIAATAATLPLAMLSWHLVEKPMLARKDTRPRHHIAPDPRVT